MLINQLDPNREVIHINLANKTDTIKYSQKTN